MSRSWVEGLRSRERTAFSAPARDGTDLDGGYSYRPTVVVSASSDECLADDWFGQGNRTGSLWLTWW
ncbi:hypothetical protein E4U42_003807 [Claviceps africana]|uniref:Uncharacterized protein n=1 Tax=Claviceps africana TaxID=83212 RepID=A0A8K0J694_9HYPO|nr:hypothetical protein E4U42_003807 [Claviceps africana]